jgi:glycosyltransferase involved in cell wall biosynthesis
MNSKRSEKPRVVIDARMVGPHGHGISLYVSQLAEGLAALSLPFEPFYLIHPDCPPQHLLRRLPHREVALRFLEPAELVGLPGVLKQLSTTLYHTPSFGSLAVYPCPHVQTVHDLNHLRFGSLVQKAYYRFLLLPSLRKARAVLSVSETAAAELRAWLRDNGANKEVQVAPNAIAAFPTANDHAELARHGLRADEYFFALGNSKPHKNLAMLERAYRAALEKNKALLPLVLSVPGSPEARMVRTGPLGDASVGALLRHARAVFSPSLYEGFGRPPLEAALEGALPVASDIPVHREVLAGVREAIFLDPEQEALWTQAFLKWTDSAAKVSEESRAWIRRTWSVERLALEMKRVYESAL